MNLALIGLLAVPPLHEPIYPAHVVARTLQALPGVAEVEVRLAVQQPKLRVLHFRNFHCETRERVRLDFERVYAKKLDDSLVEQLYVDLLFAAEEVRVE